MPLTKQDRWRIRGNGRLEKSDFGLFVYTENNVLKAVQELKEKILLCTSDEAKSIIEKKFDEVFEVFQEKIM